MPKLLICQIMLNEPKPIRKPNVTTNDAQIKIYTSQQKYKNSLLNWFGLWIRNAWNASGYERYPQAEREKKRWVKASFVR